MTMQIASCLFVHQDVLVTPLMTDLEGMMPVQPSRDLLRAPLQTQLGLDQLPNFWYDPNSAMISAAERLGMGFLGPIASQPTIATQFSTDSGFVRPDHF